MDTEQFTEAESNVDAMLLLASALKEWEQGRWTIAEKFFAQLVAAESAESYPQAEVYRSIADSYLRDHQLLQRFINAEDPASAAAARAQITLVVEAGNHLKTKGKAQEKVQDWTKKLTTIEQQFLKQEQQKQEALAKRKKRAEAQWARVKRRSEAAYAQHQYTKVQRILKSAKPTDEQSITWRSEKLYICEQILGLYAATFQALEGKSARFFIQRADEFGDYQKFLGATPEGLLVEGALNDEQLLKWKELSPQTMIELHAKIQTSRLSEAEILVRREQLVIYAWRSGLDEKAQEWAKILMKESASFSKIWNQLNPVTPQSEAD